MKILKYQFWIIEAIGLGVLVWLIMAAAPLFLGVIELFAHLLSAAKMNPTGKFYSPGLVSALVIMLPMTVYGFYVIISNNIVTGWNWLWSFLYLVIPLFTVQQCIVKRSGMKYSEFVGNALSVLFGKKEKNCDN